MSIFLHLDKDGDELDVHTGFPGGDPILLFHSTSARTKELTTVLVPRERVADLYAVLGAWLQQSGPVAPAPLTAADVRAIASQVAAEVVALHMAPQARLSDAVAARLCTVPDCKKFPGVSEHFEHDPEPHDVGHPLDPMRFRPEPDAGDGRESVGPTGTSWSDRIWESRDPVPCTLRVPQGANPRHSCPMCGHVWMIHGRDASAGPLPCGLCGQPWSDVHGQPGDPCTSAPRQLVGCECGHRTSTHLLSSGCAINECECTRTYPSAP